MLAKLSHELERTLIDIATNNNELVNKDKLQTLINKGYVTDKFGEGWMISTKGRRYLFEHKPKIDKRNIGFF